jgi:hypothetical protein
MAESSRSGGGRSNLRSDRGCAVNGSAPGRPVRFRDFGQFREFAIRFRDRIRELYPDLDVGCQGSSATGRSADTGAPFEEGRVNDNDIAISGDSVKRAARERRSVPR